jgi:hypothetical protein
VNHLFIAARASSERFKFVAETGAFRSSMTASPKDFSALSPGVLIMLDFLRVFTVGDLKLLIYATTVETRIVGELDKLFRSF